MLGVTFGSKHSYDDFGLFLASTVIGAPEPVRYQIEVPGMDGVLDLTDSITPSVRYRNRIMTYTFNTIGHTNWQAKMRDIASYLQGQRLHVVDDSDDGYYWDGICTIISQSSDMALGTIVVQVDAKPFKLKANETIKSRNGSGTLDCVNGRMEVTPEITTTASATILFNGRSFSVGAGTHKIADIVLTEGSNILTITSTGTTTVRYREGAL